MPFFVIQVLLRALTASSPQQSKGMHHSMSFQCYKYCNSASYGSIVTLLCHLTCVTASRRSAGASGC
jgi:hypothetical protein